MRKLFVMLLLLVVAQLQAQRPVVFVHGMLGSGDTWSATVQYFVAAGYNPALLEVVDWNTSGGSRTTAMAQLDSVIDAVRLRNRATQVDLVGHSAGGGLCYSYLKDSAKASKVAHYAHVGSMRLQQPASVPTLNLYSTSDAISGGADCAGATNLDLPTKDHYEIATSAESAAAMHAFFNDRPVPATPVKTTSQQKTFAVSGKVCTLGENAPEGDARVTIYELDASAGRRLKQVFEGRTRADGRWGSFTAKAGMYYEFVVSPAGQGKRTVHYFREPFTADDQLVYLRTLPVGGMAAMMLSSLPARETEATLAVFTSNNAVIHGRDRLLVNGTDIATAALAPARKTAIAHFLFDDGDQVSSGKGLNSFAMLPFMSGADVYLPADGNTPIVVEYNGRSMKLPAVKSTEGLMVAVFR